MEMRKQLIKLLQAASRSRHVADVFFDLVSIMSLTLSNAVDRTSYEEREAQYLQIIQKYRPEEQELFPKMFALVVDLLDWEFSLGGFSDVLGILFHELELHNKWVGQFFTPDDVCRMMGELLFDEQVVKNTIEQDGYITLDEPCSGAGAMILGFIHTMKQRKFNPQKQLLVHATDIDIRCVYMVYVQLSFYGIPAVIDHGNTLLLKVWSRWYTPAYILGGWGHRRRRTIQEKPTIAIEMPTLFDQDVVAE